MTRARDLSNLMGSGNFSSTTFTATAGQTAFTIAHTQGFVQVFMNGLLLDLTTDYTSNGSAITLTSAAAAGDEIEVVKYNTFSVGDAVPASGGTFTGSINASAGLTTPAGHIIQVKDVTTNTKSTTTSNSWSAVSGLTLSITPKFATSKILVSYFLSQRTYKYGAGDAQSGFGISRDNGTTILIPTQTRVLDYGYSGVIVNQAISKSFLDSPNTTSEITYKVYFYHTNGTKTEINEYGESTPPRDESSIVLMEIAQ